MFKYTKFIVLAALFSIVIAAALLIPSHQTGHIYLYGEQHSSEIILEKEFQLWNGFYQEDGMRDLFVELPYYTAEFLNIWIQSENDDIFNELYKDWEGTLVHSKEVQAFYQKIKASCPETIFHGTDVGHQYNTTGKRYLEYLRANGQESSEKYRRAQENIEQGKYYYGHSDHVYRENTMAENFVREFEKLNGADVMGIYGAAHTGLEAMDMYTNTVPCMASQLKKRYGTSIDSEDLSLLTRITEPVDTGKFTINGKEYTASYFGKQDISAFAPDYQYREFWRLEDAYEDFKDLPVSGDVLPYSNYPMAIEDGQIFVIDYTKADNSVIRMYYRSNGSIWNGLPSTEGFILK